MSDRRAWYRLYDTYYEEDDDDDNDVFDDDDDDDSDTIVEGQCTTDHHARNFTRFLFEQYGTSKPEDSMYPFHRNAS